MSHDQYDRLLSLVTSKCKLKVSSSGRTPPDILVDTGAMIRTGVDMRLMKDVSSVRTLYKSDARRHTRM